MGISLTQGPSSPNAKLSLNDAFIRKARVGLKYPAWARSGRRGRLGNAGSREVEKLGVDGGGATLTLNVSARSAHGVLAR